MSTYVGSTRPCRLRLTVTHSRHYVVYTTLYECAQSARKRRVVSQSVRLCVCPRWAWTVADLQHTSTLLIAVAVMWFTAELQHCKHQLCHDRHRTLRSQCDKLLQYWQRRVASLLLRTENVKNIDRSPDILYNWQQMSPNGPLTLGESGYQLTHGSNSA